jgi:hypothetical protein
VRYLNTVRNRLTHSGELPLLKGLDQIQSDRFTVNIVWGVLQELNQLVLGTLSGFTIDGPGRQSQHLTDLQRFFADGLWRCQRALKTSQRGALENQPF